MKFLYLALATLSVCALQAQKMDDAFRIVMESDAPALKLLTLKKSFSTQELSILDELNETVIKKRKADCFNNHFRPGLTWRRLLSAWISWSLLIGADKTMKNLPKEPTKTTDIILMAASIAACGTSLYLSIRLIQSFFAQANELEKLYLNAINIKFLLKLQMSAPTSEAAATKTK